MEKNQKDMNNESNDEVQEVNAEQISNEEQSFNEEQVLNGEQVSNEEQALNEEQVSNAETEIGIIFQRIATDESFKALLITNPDEALSEYKLTTTQAILIKSLSGEDLDKLTPDNLDEFFAADAAVYTPDEADLVDFEEYDPDDFEENENE